jgi:hypothetical protein
MRTPGPVDQTIRLVDTGVGRGAGLAAGLKAGAFISVAVRERLGPELYRVAIGGRLVTASSSALLEPGSMLKARVERTGDGILLRLASPDGRNPAADLAREAVAARTASVLSAAGLPNDPAARAALAALLREGMAPDARALARVRRAALLEGESGGEGTDLAARMEAKGMPAEDGALGEIFASLGGGGGGPDTRSGRGGGESESEAEERGPAGFELSPAEIGDLEIDFRADVPEDDLPRFLGALLRAIASRAGGGCDSLSLFNHLRGPEGSWVLVPFRFDLDAVDFAGSFRIQLPYVRGGQGRIEAFFSASRGPATEDWSFFVSFGGGRAPSLRLEPRGGASESLARSRIDDLSAQLAAASCSVRMGDRAGRGGGSAIAGNAGFDLDA